MRKKNEKNIVYVEGDATEPMGDGTKVIVHCCNDIGAWGKGFVLALSRKWKAPEESYRGWYTTRSEENSSFRLGSIQLIPVDLDEDIHVCNIIGQKGIGCNHGIPIRYEAIKEGFKALVEHMASMSDDMSVHMPRIGCGLAGGDWNMIEEIIEDTLCKAGISVTVYDLPAF